MTNYYTKGNTIHLVGKSRYNRRGKLIVWRRTNVRRTPKVVYKKKLEGQNFHVNFSLGRFGRFNTSIIALGLKVNGKIVDSISYRGPDLARLLDKVKGFECPLKGVALIHRLRLKFIFIFILFIF